MKSTDVKLKIHIVESDAYLQTYADICAEMRPDRATTVKELHDEDRTMPAGANLARYLVFEDDQVIAATNFLQAFWTPEKSLYMLTLKFVEQPKEPACRTILEAMTDRIKECGGSKINVWCPTIHSNVIAVLGSMEYRLDQSNPESILELDSLDLAQFQPSIDSLRASDLRIVSLEELLQEDPTGAMARYHELDTRLSQDIPLPWEFTGEPLESFEAHFMLERHTFDTIQVVLDGDKLVATSMLFRNRHNPIYFLTGLTGVDRAYRRRGIAQALKAINFNLAKEKGAKIIFCDNEENNPMLQLNYQLGFKPYWVWQSYTKEV